MIKITFMNIPFSIHDIFGNNILIPQQVLNRNFRVKLQIQRVYYKIINDGYPKLIIQHFEFK